MNISSLSNGVGLLSMMCYSVSSCLTSTSVNVLGNLCLVIMALLDILIDLRSSLAVAYCSEVVAKGHGQCCNILQLHKNSLT